MLNSLIESLLPGARSVRPPLIAGILWTLLFWILLSDFIPTQAESTGWPAQFYALMDSAGLVTATALCAVLVFIVGAALTTVSGLFGRIVGTASNALATVFHWQRLARQRRRRLSVEIARAQRQLAKLNTENKTKEEAARIERVQSWLTEAQHDLSELTESLSVWIRMTPDTRRIVGAPPRVAGEGLEAELVNLARSEGQDSVWSRATEAVDLDDPGRSATWHQLMFRRGGIELETNLRDDLEPDPLLALRLIDEQTFLDLDRERAERKVRVAFATPLFLLLLAIAYKTSFLLITILAIAPLAMMIRYSIDQAQERTKILRLVRLLGLSTPGLRRAYRTGVQDARLALAEWEIPVSPEPGSAERLGGMAGS